MRALDEIRKSKRMYDALADIQKSIRASRGMRIYISIHPMEERRRQGRGGLGGSSVATGEWVGGRRRDRGI